MKRICLSFIFLFVLISYETKSQDNENHNYNINLLESVGTLSSSNLYLAYLSISLLKNDIDRNVKFDNYKEIISPVETTLEIIQKQLSKIREISDLSRDDVLIIAKIEKACKLMKEDTELLIEYVQAKTDSINENFTKKHKETGEYLQDLFSISKESIDKD